MLFGTFYNYNNNVSFQTHNELAFRESLTLFPVNLSHSEPSLHLTLPNFYLIVQVTSCAHAFCKACLFDPSASKFRTKCPTCSIPLTVDFITNESAGDCTGKTTIKGFKSSSILNRIQLDDFQTSTKIEALVSVA